MKLYHLSHIDLDGYGCQYLTNLCFKEKNFYNANYGSEVSARINEIIENIKDEKDDNKERLILITDLNLTTKECRTISKIADEVGANLLLLDHHATGESASERFDWYHLDINSSATKITYKWLKKSFNFDESEEYKYIVEAINAIDIWLKDSPYFEYGKVLLGMISEAREINRVLFPNRDRDYKLSLIDYAKDILKSTPLESAHILLDESIHKHKKNFFINKEANDTKDNLVAKYITQLLTESKESMSINYLNYKGILGYNIGNTSLIGNAFLVANPDYDFYMNVNSRGVFSLRSNDKVDVSEIAQKIGNGGGHINASGGKIDGYRDSFVYSKLRDFVQQYIDEKSKNLQ